MKIRADGTHVFSSRDEYNAWLEEEEFGFAKTRIANDPGIEPFAWKKGLNMLIGLGAAWLLLTFSLSMFGMNFGIAMFVSLVISYVTLTNLGNGDGRFLIKNERGQSEYIKSYSSTLLSPRRNEYYLNGTAFVYTWMAQEAFANIARRIMINNQQFEVNTSVKNPKREKDDSEKDPEEDRTEAVIYPKVTLWLKIDLDFINELFEFGRGLFEITEQNIPVDITGPALIDNAKQLLTGMIDNALEVATEGYSARELLGAKLDEYNNKAKKRFNKKFKAAQETNQLLRAYQIAVEFQITGISEDAKLNTQRVESSIARDKSRTVNEIIQELAATAERIGEPIDTNQLIIIAQRAAGLAEPHKSQTTVHDLGPGAQRVAEIIGLSIAELFSRRKSGEDEGGPTKPSSPPSHLIDIQ